MRALTIADAFGIENLRWVDMPAGDLAPGCVRVRMRAVAFNYRDLLVISGARDVARPLVPLSDACATVVEVAEGVTRFALGDRVMPVFVQGWHSGPLPRDDSLPTLGGPLHGTMREEAVWRADDLVAVPACLTDVEAATLPCAAVSAWNALFVATRIQPGDRVLVQGTGSVSLFALQLAKIAGAHVILISSSDEKLARAAALGADQGINYVDRPDWGEALRSTIDCVVEVGGARTLEKSLICVRNGGHISVVGSLSGAPQGDLAELGRKGISLQGIRVGNRDSFEALCRVVALHALKPVIDRVAPVAEAQAALAEFRDGSHFGKVCLSF